MKTSGMLSTLTHYILSNPIKGLLTSPLRKPFRAWALVPVYAISALFLGFQTDLLRLEPITMAWAPLLAVALLISPAFLEELVFRGLLIPRNIAQRGPLWTGLAIGGSTLVYVLSHPLSALTTSPAAKPFFLDPVFLIIVTLLGITCSYSYAVSKSLWHPILIHWLTVLIWVFFLGGYDLVLALEGHAWTRTQS
jgi:uncharacterized protein